jgi:hypothetical protein
MLVRKYSLLAMSGALIVGVAAACAGMARAADMPIKAPPVTEPPWFIVNDNSVSFTWYPDATDPGVTTASHVDRYQGELTHFDVFRYGTNFFDAAYMQYGRGDPIRQDYFGQGAVEADFLWRSTLSFNSLSGTKTFSNYVTKDVSLGYGGLFITENNALSPAPHQYDLGLVFTLNLPGTVNFAVYAQKETNHNDFMAVPGPGSACGTDFTTPAAPCLFTGDRSFKVVPHLELLISEPITFFTGVPLTWNGFTGVNFPKGTGISQANLNALAPGCAAAGLTSPANLCSDFTKTEVFEDNRIILDAGKLAFNKAGIWETYVGYRYWYNKFGTDHNAPLFSCNGTAGCIAPNTSIESTAYVGTTYHFK